ncbi:cyclic nucleotide-binding protein [marine bacterium AO1-C]|nr:cyclic nucleotide-binding protein [marine bacterium AO1-C]
MLKQFLHKIHPVEDAILDEYVECWQEFNLPKKTLMTSAGNIEHYFYFVKQGVQKSYYLHEGKSHVIAFTYPPSFSGVPESFMNQTPSQCFLETITDSEFLRISFREHLQMLDKHRALERLFSKAWALIFQGMMTRYYQLMALSTEERFRAFVARSPHLLQIVPQKDIASYLRIDVTNFSKLMNKIRI